MANAVFDLSDLKRLAAVLRIVEPIYLKDLYSAVGAAGELVASRARENASFSRRIPASVKTRRRGLRVTIQAGGPGVGDAAPLEHGGRPGTFRHPVFGNKNVWVEQAAHPFLTPAVEETEEEGFALVVGAVDSALRGISVV